MDKIKHIVFDIGQVFLHWDPEVPFRTLITPYQKFICISVHLH